MPPTQKAKDYIIENIKSSLRTPNGDWHEGIARRRNRVKDILETEPRSSEAATLRSLGLDNEDLTAYEFVEKAVHWQGFMTHEIVKFVRYDEHMYNFVKSGETTHDKTGILVSKSGNSCAKASDWYDEMDRTVVGL